MTSPMTPPMTPWSLARRLAGALPALREAVRPGPGGPELGAALGLLGEIGALRAPLPVAEGGAGLARGAEAALPLCTILRRLGRTDLSLARLFEGHVNAVRLIEVHGRGAPRDRVRRLVREGALLGVWGADDSPPVRLCPDPGGAPSGPFRLEGRKRFASGLGLVTHAIVTARTEAGVQMVLVEATEPARQDPAAWTASAMRASVSGGFDAEGLAPAPGDLLAGPGALMTEPHFEGGIWRYCAAHVGGAEALVEETRKVLDRAGRLADPIQRARLGQAYAAADTARLATEAAALITETAVDGTEEAIRRAVARALLARETVESRCTEIMALCERALGTLAHDAAQPVDMIRRDLSLFLRQAAPDAKLDRAVDGLIGDGAPEVGEAW